MLAEKEWDIEGIWFWAASPEWHRDAACKGMDPAIFYPERGGDDLTRRAVAVCNGCSVREECEDAGKDELGIWGGKPQYERRTRLRRRPTMKKEL